MGLLSQIASWASPYIRLMRLHKRAGMWLLLWPCWFGVALGSEGLPDLRLLLLFLAGSLVMRSAGCVINDIVDRDIDREVERTRLRPLASGELKLHHAVSLLVVLMAAAFAIGWNLPFEAMALAWMSVPLVVAYPFMKRLTHWPQAWLGITFNWGALVGFAATGALDASAWWLYGACVFWTLGYDTIYALQDVEDDSRIGVKSTAVFLRRHVRAWVAVFYGMSAAMAGMACISAGLDPFCWFGIGALALHFAWQVWAIDLNDGVRSGNIFRSNAWAGWLLFGAIVLGQWK
ncbi:MAG: 4-hydroxybenzoate octaprenyltransferase [Alphaproteobacteria bacterium]|nr:4-hydroxybenzoate octaprenyltransferase [Alphaproteobacteria bacterium]